MKRLGLALLALLVFGVAVVVLLPASLVVSMALPEGGPLRAEDVRGGLWSGSIVRLSWQGHALGSAHWQLRPAALLRGRLEADVSVAGDAVAQCRAWRGFGASGVEGLEAELPAPWLDGVVASPGLRPQGRLTLSIAQARFDGDRITAMQGEARWRDAAVSGAASAALGELRAPFALGEDGRVHGRVHDEGGPLAAEGEFVADLSGYQADLRLSARDPRIAGALQWFGQPDAGGGQRLLLQGSR